MDECDLAECDLVECGLADYGKKQSIVQLPPITSTNIGWMRAYIRREQGNYSLRTGRREYLLNKGISTF